MSDAGSTELAYVLWPRDREKHSDNLKSVDFLSQRLKGQVILEEQWSFDLLLN